MTLARRTPSSRSAFTLVELIAVIIVLAILAGVAVPKYFDYTSRAKESATKATLGATRSAIANFYANSSFESGTARYPTIEELRTLGAVLDQPLPENPFNGSSEVRNRRWDESAPPAGGNQGWNYDQRTGRFWANTDTEDIDENEW